MKFEGIYTAILTPFSAGGDSVDYGAYKEMIERQVKAGVAGVVPCGTTGESPTLSHAEHRELIKKTVEFAAGRIQVIAGTGSNSTREAISLTKDAVSDGVDAVMLVNPYYNKPTQEGLFQHFRTVAQSVTAPVVIYNIQGRTAVNVEVDTFRRLLEVPNIAAIKEASGDLGQMARIQKAVGHKMSMLSGDDNITPAVMAIGGRGVISVFSNLYPRRLVKMVESYLRSDYAAGNAIFYSVLDLMNAMFWETNPIPVKAAAAMMKYCRPDIRLPLVPMSADKAAKLGEMLRAFGDDA